MSSRTRDLPRRSCLSVPGSSPKMLEKAAELAADLFILDLEDSVAASQKSNARHEVTERIKSGAWESQVLAVRVNAVRTEWFEDDVREVVSAGDRLDEILVPKVDSAEDVRLVDALLGDLERQLGLESGHIGMEVQIETALGMLNCAQICSESPRIEAVVFGPADFSAAMGMPQLTGGSQSSDYPGDQFHFPLFTILVAARAAGIQAIDGPFLKLNDPEGLRESAMRSRSLGYDGKWAIHPDQIEVLNETFSPSQEDFDRASDLLDAYERANAQDKGAARLGNEMIDEASKKMAISLVARGERSGMRHST